MATPAAATAATAAATVAPVLCDDCAVLHPPPVVNSCSMCHVTACAHALIDASTRHRVHEHVLEQCFKCRKTHCLDCAIQCMRVPTTMSTWTRLLREDPTVPHAPSPAVKRPIVASPEKQMSKKRRKSKHPGICDGCAASRRLGDDVKVHKCSACGNKFCNCHWDLNACYCDVCDEEHCHKDCATECRIADNEAVAEEDRDLPCEDCGFSIRTCACILTVGPYFNENSETGSLTPVAT